MKVKNKTIIEAAYNYVNENNIVRNTYEIEKAFIDGAKFYRDFNHSKNINVNPTTYYYLNPKDAVKIGDEYYDSDELNDWIEITDITHKYFYDPETMYRMRRKIKK